MISEKEIIERLQDGLISLPPLEFKRSARPLEPGGKAVDAIIWVCWGEQRQEFAVEFKAVSTPKVMREATYRVKAAAQSQALNPMIIVPYLSEDALREIEREGVSGVDLCGNGIVVVPDRLFVCRTGNPNRFPSSAPIKNIYRKNSSMVARVFLVRPWFNRITDIRDEISLRNLFGVWAGLPMTLPTVSKALKGLEDDLIVGREGSAVRLVQPEKLFNRLIDNYSKPKIKQVINWKFPTSSQAAGSHILKEAFNSQIPAVVTGAGSVSRYAVMQVGDTLPIYCPDPKGWLANLPGAQSDRFPTISIIQSEDAPVYFDARPDEGMVWASPVQAFLELMSGDKRDQETALQVKDTLLRRFREEQR